MFSRILTSALFAGFITGVIAAVLQLIYVQPVLLHAELYESGQAVHFGANTAAQDAPSQIFDPIRDGLSILFTTVIYVGYGLIMIAFMSVAEERGASITPRTGLIWGLAGFIAVQFAPAIGLPPELPGSAAADVAARQIWWFGTVAATAIALWLIAFGTNWTAWAAAIALVLIPHIVGAPHPNSFIGPVPPELAGLFASRALGIGMTAWIILGILSAYFWHRETDT